MIHVDPFDPRDWPVPQPEENEMVQIGQTDVVHGLVGSNDTIERIRSKRLPVLKTHTRKGVVWHFDGTLEPLPSAPCERLVTKGILVPREASGQSFELAPAWAA